jgi:hypothetical protein
VYQFPPVALARKDVEWAGKVIAAIILKGLIIASFIVNAGG